MNKTKLSKNLIITFCSYAFLLVANIFVSKIVLISYGSEVNGLLSSVNQVFSYIALLEAGIGTATTMAFFKPLAQEDEKEINRVYSASVVYYRSVLKWYLLCVIAVSFIWPFLLKTTIDYWTIFGVISIQGVSNALTFYFVSTITNYLLASGKNYINAYVHTAITIITYIAKAIVSLCGGHVLIITATLLAINILKCIFYWCYKKVKCKDIRIEPTVDKGILGQRNAFLIHEISGCVFSATDLILISIFCSLKMASVYAVYSMVVLAISTIIAQVFNSTRYLLGEAYQTKNYEAQHDRFNVIYIAVVFCLYTITYLLLFPFISLYTQGVEDANYTDKYLPVLFIGIQLLSSCRCVDGELIKIAAHAKQTISRTITETLINLSVSLALVNIIGIYGVLVGTIVALLYRMNDIILYTNKNILHRSAWKEYKLYLLNFIVFVVFMLLNGFFPMQAMGYGQLIIKAMIVSVMVGAVYILVNFIAFNKRVFK